VTEVVRIVFTVVPSWNNSSLHLVVSIDLRR